LEGDLGIQDREEHHMVTCSNVCTYMHGMFTLGGNELLWFGVTLSMIYQINIAILSTE